MGQLSLSRRGLFRLLAGAVVAGMLGPLSTGEGSFFEGRSGWLSVSSPESIEAWIRSFQDGYISTWNNVIIHEC